MDIRNDRKYAKTHEWAMLEGDILTVGISAIAAELLGDVVFVETPEVGAAVTAGGNLTNVESVKAVADAYAPLSGEIVEINAALEDAPELLNSAPYDTFIAKIKVNPADFDTLMDATAYKTHCENEAH